MIVGPRVGHRTLHLIRTRIMERLTSINLLRVSPIKVGDSLTRVGDNLTKREIRVGDLKVSPIKAGDLRVNLTRVGDKQDLRVSLIKGGTHRDSPIKAGDKQDIRANLTKANLTRVGDIKLLLVGASKDTSRDMVQLPEMMIT